MTRAAVQGAQLQVEPQAILDTTFTYQGQLKRSGELVTATCSFQFSLWPEATGGAQVGSTQEVDSVAVTDGLFTALLNFGAVFTGETRWLQMAVKCGAEDDFTTLTPRQALTATPYALAVQPGMHITGDVPQPGRAVLRGDNTGSGVGVWGKATSNAGVYGEATAANGAGVWGFTALGTYGVFGQNTNPDGGAGVQGRSNQWYGVRGDSVSGQGVWGESQSSVGVIGKSQSGIGVYGESSSAFGVQGKSTTGAGTVGTSRDWIGVYGESSSAFGVQGNSTTGAGTVGTSRDWIGVYGESANNEGVRGVSKNRDHGGVVGVNEAGGIAVYGISVGGGYAAFFDGKMATKVLEIQGGGDLAERFDVHGTAQSAPGTLMVIDEAHPGKLKPSDVAYDPKVAGIVSGAGGVNPGLTLHQAGVMEGDHVVAIAGRVYVKADATKGPIRPGDRLTTSTLPGHAMRAFDSDRADGAVIGKAMTGLDHGTGLVLVLVNLQ